MGGIHHPQMVGLLLGFPLCIASINIPNGCFLSHGGTPSSHPFRNGCSMKSIIYFGVPPFVETPKYFRGYAISNIFRSSGFWLLGSMGNPLDTSRGMLMGILVGFYIQYIMGWLGLYKWHNMDLLKMMWLIFSMGNPLDTRESMKRTVFIFLSVLQREIH